MQVFKTYLKILKKNIPSMSIYLFVFLLLAFVLSRSGKENGVSQFTTNKIDMAVINEDEGELGGELKAYLGGINNLVELKNDKEILQDELYYRNVEYILLIPKDFSSKLANGDIENLCENIKIPGSYTGKYVDIQIEQYISTLESYLIAKVPDKQALEYTRNDLSMALEVNLLNNKISTSMTSDYHYFKYLPYVLISLIILGMGPILMVFNSKEINDRTMCSSLPLKKKNMQLILGCVVTVTAMYLLFMALAFILYGENIGLLKGILYLVNCFVFVLIATGMGYLISILTKSINTLNMISNTVGLGMSFLGGVFVPQALMGEKVLNFSKFIPTYWYINAVENIQTVSSNKAVLKDIQVSIGVEVMFAIAFFAVALVATRIRSNARSQMN